MVEIAVGRSVGISAALLGKSPASCSQKTKWHLPGCVSRIGACIARRNRELQRDGRQKHGGCLKPPLVVGTIDRDEVSANWMTATAKCLAVFCFTAICCLYSLSSLADAPLMAIPGVVGVGGAPGPGDNGFTPDGIPNAPNATSGGAFTYAIPIVAPPGTNRMVPHIALTYSSQSGDRQHIGVGWGISGLSEITRCPQTIAEDGRHGSVNFDSNDRYCLDGQRLILTSTGNYGGVNTQYHTEIESFRKILACSTSKGNGPACFDVWTKDGVHYQYGYTTNSHGSSGAQILAGATVRVWALSQVTDTNGNSIAYTWVADYGDYAISRIDYAGGAQNSIQFFYNTARN